MAGGYAQAYLLGSQNAQAKLVREDDGYIRGTERGPERKCLTVTDGVNRAMSSGHGLCRSLQVPTVLCSRAAIRFESYEDRKDLETNNQPPVTLERE